MLVGDPTTILDVKKHYMNPATKTVFTGNAWIKIKDRSKYEVFYAEEFKDFIEVIWDKKKKEWKKNMQ